jgi:hypothetical protein
VIAEISSQSIPAVSSPHNHIMQPDFSPYMQLHRSARPLL